MSESFDVVVVGGGLLGAAVAYHLSRERCRVLVVDREDKGKATLAGAGILSPETNTRDPEDWFLFAREAVEYYPTLTAMLEEDGAGDTGYRRCGKLLVAVSEHELELYEQARQRILERQERLRSSTLEDDIVEISPDEALKAFPALAPPLAALYHKSAAQVDGRLLTSALLIAAKNRGVMVVSDEVVDIGVETGRVQWVKTLERTYATQTVVLAGGAWSKKLSRSLNYTIPVEPQRGQIIHFKVTDNSSPGLWAMMSNFGGYYFVPWPDGRVVFGATREDGSGYAPHTTLDGVHELLSEVKRVAPGLGSAELHEIRIGLRPLTQDKMPVLGRIPSVDGVLLATGHGPTGLQLGPFSGRLVADLALGRQPQVNIDPFSVTRFTSGRESMTTKH